jgi:hypothetical protein
MIVVRHDAGVEWDQAASIQSGHRRLEETLKNG